MGETFLVSPIAAHVGFWWRINAPFSYRCQSEYHWARAVAEALSERLGLRGDEVCSKDRSERWNRGEETIIDCQGFLRRTGKAGVVYT